MFHITKFFVLRRLSSSTTIKKKPDSSQKHKMKSLVDILQYNSKISVKNEPILQYQRGSSELKNLECALEIIQNNIEDIPIVIGDKEMKTNDVHFQVIPHRHHQKIAKYYWADESIINKAIRTALKAKAKWERVEVETRMAIWLKAADLMSTKYRAQLVAATMLGQSKTIHQAEIDAGSELVNFIRMNAGFLNELYKCQPMSDDSMQYKNHTIWRGLDGFVAAISPFNFTSIVANLTYTPALMGNCVLWKPSESAILSNWLIFKIMREAGLPEGVVNFIPSNSHIFNNTIAYSSNLGGINFTGSVATFQTLWRLVAKHLHVYKTLPRLLGQCGGKNYHFVHASADVDTVVATTIRSAFECSGQNSSACSRLYVPDRLWLSSIKRRLCEETAQLLVGDISDYQTFLGAVIDDKAFLRIAKYLDHAITNPQCEVLVGGRCSNLRGYFIAPTIIECRDPFDILFKEEILGPLLSVYVYKENETIQTLDLVNSATGSIFAKDDVFLKQAIDKLRTSAGYMYINDKSTGGAVVGQQPFGGGKLSGTNDKAGSPYYLMRWSSPLTIKEAYEPQTEIYYPYMKIKEDIK